MLNERKRILPNLSKENQLILAYSALAEIPLR
jgi:hypothetical protein